MKWEEKLYLDTALPFGLRSAPKIFTAVADALEWAMKKRGVSAHAAEHYLDDFILLGSPHSQECQANLDTALTVCSTLGVPLAREKLVGPATCLTFLGIEVDTASLELRLPEEKLMALRDTVMDWQGKKCCTKRELLSFIGQLSHACKVVKPGRRFLRRLINLASTARLLSRTLRLNTECRADISWWSTFLLRWNGVSMLWNPCIVQVAGHIYSDALRCILRDALVSTAVGRSLDERHHSCKGNGSNPVGVVSLGRRVGWTCDPVQLR